MSIFGLAMIGAVLIAEPCAIVRREQGQFNAKLFPRLERLNRAQRRADGSQRSPTAAERKQFAAIEAEVEAFIDRFNARLTNCRDN